jgi:tRNA threonylcarbamoyladenosine modification (KEOPS) complex  Pcc1 subunit
LAVRLNRAAEEKKKTDPEAVRTAPRQGVTTMKETRAKAIEKILLNVEAKMSDQNMKATLGDYIRLIQLVKEMGEEPKAEIKVTWIEDPELSPFEK